MTKLNTGLTGLLVIQLLFAAALFWNQKHPTQQHRLQPLLKFQAEQLDRIVVSDREHSVTLAKEAGGWTIPELDQLPADTVKLNAQLEKLQRQQTGWPVATTTGSHRRFEVAEDTFHRRVQLYRGDVLAGELLIGTSPGFRSSHVRRAGDDAVYSLKLNAFEWPAKAEDWLDKALLAAKDPQQIRGPDYVLVKRENGWQFDTEAMRTEGVESLPQVNQEKARQLVSALKNLRIQSPADFPPQIDSAGSVMNIEVTILRNIWKYRFAALDDRYYVSRNDRKNAFGLSKYDYERIANVNRDQLVVKQPENEQDRTNPAGEKQGEAR